MHRTPAVLSPRTTWGELLRHLGERGGANPPDEGREDGPPCLARLVGDGLRLRASIRPAIHPLPEAPADLDPRLARASTFKWLSLFGEHGAGPFLVASLTPAPPPAEQGAIVMALTDRRVFLRTTGATPPSLASIRSLEETREALRTASSEGYGPLLLTAEEGLPLERLVEALRVLDRADLAVALAASLPSETRPPRALDRPRESAPPECALPDRELGAGPPRELLRARVHELRPLLERCRRSATSASAARGGRARLEAQLSADGSVEASCVTHDELAEPAIRRCIEAAPHRVSWPPADDGEPYRVALPIRWARDRSLSHRALCRGSA